MAGGLQLGICLTRKLEDEDGILLLGPDARNIQQGCEVA